MTICPAVIIPALSYARMLCKAYNGKVTMHEGNCARNDGLILVCDITTQAERKQRSEYMSSPKMIRYKHFVCFTRGTAASFS
jgi:hypothetical protein